MIWGSPERDCQPLSILRDLLKGLEGDSGMASPKDTIFEPSSPFQLPPSIELAIPEQGSWEVVERAAVMQLQAFLDDTTIFDPLQSGFCPGLEMKTMLVTLMDDIQWGRSPLLLHFDLTAAFIMVNHHGDMGGLSYNCCPTFFMVGDRGWCLRGNYLSDTHLSAVCCKDWLSSWCYLTSIWTLSPRLKRDMAWVVTSVLMILTHPSMIWSICWTILQ